MSGYAAVVLAAGQGTRFRAAGGHGPTKVLSPLGTEPLVRRVVTTALGSRAAPVILVTGHAGEAVAAAVADLTVGCVHNARFESGLAGSLRTGIDAVPPSCAGAVVMLADMPGVSVDTLDALVARAAALPGAHALVPTYGQRRGNPVLLARALFGAVARLAGDAGARHLLRDPALRIEEVPVGDPGILQDVDLPEHLRAVHAGVAGPEPPFTLR